MAGGMLGDLVSLSLKEGKRRVLTLAVLFAVGAIVALAVVLKTPKTWDATAVVVAEGNNIIKPLMEGRAVPTTVADQTALVTNVMQSRRILREILTFGGWLIPNRKIDPRDEEKLIAQLRSRVRIDSIKGEMIKISYRDTDPVRTYQIANRVAEIYVREGSEGKERESREAFDFISKQVTEYGQKLAEAHEKLLAYYRNDGSATRGTLAAPSPGTTPSPTPPVPAGTTRLKISAEQLAALRLEESTLAAQLGRRALPAAGRDESRQTEEQFHTRVNALQVELDRLTATFTDEHPDVRRVRRDLAAAKEELRRVDKARLDRENARATATALDDQVSAAARGRLEEVRRQIAAATGTRPRSSSSPRPAALVVTPEAALIPEMRNVGQDTGLSELSRRYEATRDVYQDLLKRRENARVSMELDLERRGLTLRIHEAAELPVISNGLRLMHQTLIGLVLACGLPIGFLLALVRLDPRVRSPSQVERGARLPFLVSIPYAAPTSREFQDRNRRMIAISIVIAVVIIYGISFIIRLKATYRP